MSYLSWQTISRSALPAPATPPIYRLPPAPPRPDAPAIAACPNWQADAREALMLSNLPLPSKLPIAPPHAPPPDVPPAYGFPSIPVMVPPNLPSLSLIIGQQLDAHINATEHAHPASAIDIDTSEFTGVLEAVNSIISTAQAVATELDQHQHDALYLKNVPFDGGLF